MAALVDLGKQPGESSLVLEVTLKTVRRPVKNHPRDSMYILTAATQ